MVVPFSVLTSLVFLTHLGLGITECSVHYWALSSPSFLRGVSGSTVQNICLSNWKDFWVISCNYKIIVFFNALHISDCSPTDRERNDKRNMMQNWYRCQVDRLPWLKRNYNLSFKKSNTWWLNTRKYLWDKQQYSEFE